MAIEGSLMDATPIQPSSFPFLRLPRELRDNIYYYAMLCPLSLQDHLDNEFPADVCEVVTSQLIYDGSYWGREESTRLFRVNRQVCVEALVAFYSSFIFCFPPWTNTGSIDVCHRKALTPWSRSLTRNVSLRMEIYIPTADQDLRAEHNRWTHLLPALMQLLPSLNKEKASIELSLGFYMWHFDPSATMEAAEETVDRVVDYAKPLIGLKGLTVKCHYASRCQTEKIMGQIREILKYK